MPTSLQAVRWLPKQDEGHRLPMPPRWEVLYLTQFRPPLRARLYDRANRAWMEVYVTGSGPPYLSKCGTRIFLERWLNSHVRWYQRRHDGALWPYNFISYSWSDRRVSYLSTRCWTCWGNEEFSPYIHRTLLYYNSLDHRWLQIPHAELRLKAQRRLGGCTDRIEGRAKDREEGIPLGVDLDPSVSGDRITEERVVRRQQGRISITKRGKDSCRAFDVGE